MTFDPCSTQTITVLHLGASNLPCQNGNNRIARLTIRTVNIDCRFVYFFSSYVRSSILKGRLSQANYVEKQGVHHPYRFSC
jgi:hypothetical protein